MGEGDVDFGSFFSTLRKMDCTNNQLKLDPSKAGGGNIACVSYVVDRGDGSMATNQWIMDCFVGPDGAWIQ